MWQALRLPTGEGPPPERELIHSTARSLMIVVGGIYAAFALATAFHPEQSVTVGVWVFLPLIVPLWLVAYLLLPRHFLASQLVWQAGLAAAAVLGVSAAQRPEVALFLAWLPLMGAVAAGWAGALASEGLVLAAAAWLLWGPAGRALPTPLALAIVCGGALSGLLGWASTHSLLAVLRWTIAYCDELREKADEARDQRLELRQVQADLLQANQELARLSDRLRALVQVAEEARRAKEEFVSNVSHELRTPLNMIIGFSEMIPRLSQVYGTKLPPALLADIAAIRRNSQHLAKLVDDVLDLSQVEAGRMALIREWVSLREIVDEAVVAVKALFESKGLYLETEFAADLPAAFCDGTRIRQVVLNLLSNAGRFADRGGVRVLAWRAGQEVIVSVADTGPGIAAADRERIFEPFQQIDSSVRRRHGGSGLGLSISKRFVEMHGGRMWLESKVGAGTTFYFSLPIEPPALSATLDGAARWFSPYSEHEYRLRTRPSKAPVPSVVARFVVLEQHGSLQRLFERYLGGVEVAPARTVEQAMEALNHSPAQALLINAPPAEALRTRQLADLPFGTPAIMCWLPGEDEAARQLGVVRYLVKPFTHETLLGTLRKLGGPVETVLVVDDEPEALQLFTRMLSLAPQGYRVLQAKNGRRALDLLRRRHPDCVLLDLVMPGMDGFQVLQEKSHDETIRDIPVVVISARDPTGEPIVSDTLTVTRSGGLSVRELLTSIQALSELLAPSGARPAGQAQPGTPPG